MVDPLKYNIRDSEVRQSIPNNFTSMDRLLGQQPKINVSETDEFDDLVQRQISGQDKTKRIDQSARGQVSGILNVEVDASTSVINNFLSVGTGDQTVERSVPTPEWFGGSVPPQKIRENYKFKLNNEPSVGSVNISNDQAGIQRNRVPKEPVYEPAPSPTPSPTPSISSSATPTPTSSNTPTPTPTSSNTPTPTPTPSPSSSSGDAGPKEI